jgi:arylsulfatase A-like enzyme
MGQQCLLARRLAESGVRFVQVNDSGWDHHGSIRKELPKKCKNMDKPVAALLRDLKQRGLLDDTLVIWGGEFGRTPFDQDLSLGTAAEETRGREHNPHGFTMWMAGGGVKPGIVHGSTDDFAYRAQEGKIHLHDLHATILHLLGLDHERLTHRYAGRDFRLTDVYGRVVNEILA